MTFLTLWRVTGADGRVLLESVWEPHVSAFLASRRERVGSLHLVTVPAPLV